MSKYSALSQYLASLSQESIDLSFSQIEEILGDSLPRSARLHPHQWWSNDTRNHSWSQLWLAAGWKTEGSDFKDSKVSFRRTSLTKEDELAALRPGTRETIFDLLGLTSISTDAWLTTSTGADVESVKANPSFCYDWAFGSLHEGFALCVWHGTLIIKDGCIVFRENMRELAAGLRAESRNSANEASRRNRALTQAVRAKAFDDALDVSYSRGLPVSVILTDGDRTSRENLGAGSSHVQVRCLDPVKWYVHSYNEGTGEVLLVRGVKPAGIAIGSVDDDALEAPDEVQQRAIKVRRGQAAFRERVLAAYQRRCAVTSCRIVDLLEAAHIQPHAEEPNYRASNGLLLRADIHTLFDLNLLTVDPRYRIQLAPVLMGSEYKVYHNQPIHLPDLPSEMPSDTALNARYQVFKKHHVSGS